MEFASILDYQDRLTEIVESAYRILCQKVAGNRITIYNEASLQLHLGAALKTLGELYEFSADTGERFVIELEKTIEIPVTSKSNGKARCDIAIAFNKGSTVLAQALIELKYFKASIDQNSAEATKDNRFSLFMDMENLEKYRETKENSKIPTLCYEIAIAQNYTYANPLAKASLKTGNGCMTDDSRTFTDTNDTCLVRYTTRKPIDLKGNYLFEWTSYANNKHCLIIKLK